MPTEVRGYSQPRDVMLGLDTLVRGLERRRLDGMHATRDDTVTYSDD
jgi:hypothetical protein